MGRFFVGLLTFYRLEYTHQKSYAGHYAKRPSEILRDFAIPINNLGAFCAEHRKKRIAEKIKRDRNRRKNTEKFIHYSPLFLNYSLNNTIIKRLGRPFGGVRLYGMGRQVAKTDRF